MAPAGARRPDRRSGVPRQTDRGAACDRAPGADGRRPTSPADVAGRRRRGIDPRLGGLCVVSGAHRQVRPVRHDEQWESQRPVRSTRLGGGGGKLRRPFALPFPEASTFEVDPTLLPPPRASGASSAASSSDRVWGLAERVGVNAAKSLRASLAMLPLALVGLVGGLMVLRQPNRGVVWVLLMAAMKRRRPPAPVYRAAVLFLALFALTVPAALLVDRFLTGDRPLRRRGMPMALVATSIAVGLSLILQSRPGRSRSSGPTGSGAGSRPAIRSLAKGEDRSAGGSDVTTAAW